MPRLGGCWRRILGGDGRSLPFTYSIHLPLLTDDIQGIPGTSTNVRHRHQRSIFHPAPAARQPHALVRTHQTDRFPRRLFADHSNLFPPHRARSRVKQSLELAPHHRTPRRRASALRTLHVRRTYRDSSICAEPFDL